MMPGMRFGATLDGSGVTFRIWAPAARRVDLMLDRAQAMQPQPEGWFELTVPGARVGTRYKYRIDGEHEVPDPASHYQPEDVFGPSEVIDHDRFSWRTSAWRGRPWSDAVLLELHVGTFTPGGTFRSAIDKLDHLVETGIGAIELMPLADFAGRRNWGYDGVLWYAPDSTYGHPDDLRSLVDAAHARGLMVLLDVVYNHFGPEGNYLHGYAPTLFGSAHTPWGQAIDYGVPQVRAFAVENALHWLQRYRFDGLRLDAVHAIVEPGRSALLADLSRVVGHLAATTSRQIHLVLENDDNTARLLDPLAEAPQGKYRAQWNDDAHHAFHVLLTGEHKSYYRDYADDPVRHIAQVLSSGFAYQGEVSPHRGGRRRGEPSASLSPLAFVNFLQNHDQIGNRPLGDRLTLSVDERKLAAALSVILLVPAPPLLFMGEEWGSKNPFPFFCDFEGALADAVRQGRRREFREAYATMGDDIPDPLLKETFDSAVLDWNKAAEPAGRARLALVRGLLTVRRREITPHLSTVTFGAARHEHNVLIASWRLAEGKSLMLLANLSDQPGTAGPSLRPGRPIWGGDPGNTLPPWSVHWSIGEA